MVSAHRSPCRLTALSLRLNSSRVGATERSPVTASAGTTTRYSPSPTGPRPNSFWVRRTSLTTTVTVSAGDAHLHRAQQDLDLGGRAGKTDTEQLAHRAAAAVAADEKPRAQPCAVGEFGAHPRLVLAQSDQLAAAPYLGAEPRRHARPAGGR